MNIPGYQTTKKWHQCLLLSVGKLLSLWTCTQKFLNSYFNSYNCDIDLWTLCAHCLIPFPSTYAHTHAHVCTRIQEEALLCNVSISGLKTMKHLRNSFDVHFFLLSSFHHLNMGPHYLLPERLPFGLPRGR